MTHHNRDMKKHLPTANTTKEEISALKSLNHLAVVPTDKTNKICILSKDFVSSKMNDLVSDTTTYSLLPEDPSKKIEKQANNLWSEIFCDNVELPVEQYNHLVTRHAQAPSLKCLMKDHKPDFPHCAVRPIQPIKGSAIEKLDRILGYILGQCRQFHTYTVSNTPEVQARLKKANESFRPNWFQFSLDVKSMYPSLPTCDRAIEVVHRHLLKHYQKIDMMGLKVSHVIEILKFTLANITLRVNTQYYKQNSGVGTGYYSSGAYGGVILQETLESVIDDKTPIPCFSLYVDDGHSIWSGTKEELDEFISCLNDVWPSLEFIPEFEDKHQSLPFLDLKIVRTDKGFHTTFYRKPTHSGSYLHYTSHCPMIQKINIVKNETRRIMFNCTFSHDATPHLSQLKNDLKKSGYPEHFIEKYMSAAQTTPPSKNYSFDPKTPAISIPYISEAYTRVVKKELQKAGIEATVVVKSTGNLKRRFHHATPREDCETNKQEPKWCEACTVGIPCHTRNLVYNAKCRLCENSYVGVTTRPFKDRFGEHEASIRLKNTKSALSAHLMGNPEKDQPGCPNPMPNPRGFEWSILDRGSSFKDSFFREALLINKEKPTLNRTKSGWVII